MYINSFWIGIAFFAIAYLTSVVHAYLFTLIATVWREIMERVGMKFIFIISAITSIVLLVVVIFNQGNTRVFDITTNILFPIFKMFLSSAI